jgi:hypothetical protein
MKVNLNIKRHASTKFADIKYGDLFIFEGGDTDKPMIKVDRFNGDSGNCVVLESGIILGVTDDRECWLIGGELNCWVTRGE